MLPSKQYHDYEFVQLMLYCLRLEFSNCMHHFFAIITGIVFQQFVKR